jgi:hypothetical protein
MNTAVAIDLADLKDALESLAKRLPKLSLKEKVDIAARLKAVEKTTKLIDETVKDEIKAKLSNKDGIIPGDIFKAILAFHDETRLDQQMLEVEYPKVFAKCRKTKPVGRVTFEVR